MTEQPLSLSQEPTFASLAREAALDVAYALACVAMTAALVGGVYLACAVLQ